MWWLVLALVQAAADGQSLLSSLQKEGNQYKNNHTIHHQRYLQQQQSSPVYAIVNNDESNSMDDSLILKSLESIPPNAAETGAWSPLHYFPVVAAHAAVMPNGKVLAYGSPAGEEAIDGRTLVFWDYRQGFGRSSMTISKNHPQEVDNFCSSGNLLADGTFLASGGAAAVGTSKESVLINYQTETSVRAADLQLTRWYGTMTKLGDGQLLITGGTGAKGEGDPSATPEIYNGKEWKLLPGAMSYEFFVEEERLWYPHQWLTNRGTVFGISMDKVRPLNEALVLSCNDTNNNNVTNPLLYRCGNCPLTPTGVLGIWARSRLCPMTRPNPMSADPVRQSCTLLIKLFKWVATVIPTTV